MLNKVKCRGLLKTLKERFYPNFVRRNVKTRFTKKKTNGMRVGDLFHRQVYHYFKCYNKTSTCVCRKRFKRRTTNVKLKTIHHARLTAVKKFLEEAQWHVFDCELVAGFAHHKLATAIDMVCVDNLLKPEKIFVVELKFGYERGLHDFSSDNPKYQKMSGRTGCLINDTFANHHQLQLWFEIEALKETYGIEAANGVVLYIHDGPRPKKGEAQKCKYHTEFAHAWWFRKEDMRKALLKQLFEINLD